MLPDEFPKPGAAGSIPAGGTIFSFNPFFILPEGVSTDINHIKNLVEDKTKLAIRCQTKIEMSGLTWALSGTRRSYLVYSHR